MLDLNPAHDLPTEQLPTDPGGTSGSSSGTFDASTPGSQARIGGTIVKIVIALLVIFGLAKILS
ncbi:MAG: hypothetical protein ACRD4Q_01150 [Candidatus Acidiferrales bacterium]